MAMVMDMVSGLSLLVNCYLEIKFYKNIRFVLISFLEINHIQYLKLTVQLHKYVLCSTYTKIALKLH